MAVDPATLKAAAQVATTVLSDEKGRRGILIACLVPLAIILLVLSSPFAIFFSLSGEFGEQISVVSVLYEMRQEFQHNIQLEEADSKVDEIHTIIVGSEDGNLIDNSADVLIAYAIKYNMTEENAEQMAVLEPGQVDKLREVYNDMNTMTVSTETRSEEVEVERIDGNGDLVTRIETVNTRVKTITVESLTAEEIGLIYSFDEIQTSMIREMRRCGYGEIRASSNSSSTLDHCLY